MEAKGTVNGYKLWSLVFAVQLKTVDSFSLYLSLSFFRSFLAFSFLDLVVDRRKVGILLEGVEPRFIFIDFVDD
jgi:hypothetical protein